jgi:hypothetical protein
MDTYAKLKYSILKKDKVKKRLLSLSYLLIIIKMALKLSVKIATISKSDKLGEDYMSIESN